MTECNYIFVGKVLPERALLDTPEVSFSTFGAADVSDGELRVVVLKSQITARFTTSGRVDNVYTLRNIVEDAVMTNAKLAARTPSNNMQLTALRAAADAGRWGLSLWLLI